MSTQFYYQLYIPNVNIITKMQSGLNNLHASRFLRVRNSENYQQLQPVSIKQKILKNQYFFLDFNDERNVKILQKSDPNDSEQQTHTVGKDHIAGINNLSTDTYKLLQYLSENRAVNEHKNKIDEIVRTRIKRIQQRRRMKEEQAAKTRRRKIKNYSLDGNNVENQQVGGKRQKLPDTYGQLQSYLQRAHNDILLEKLKKGQTELQKSLSSAGDFKKLDRNQSLDFKIQNSIDIKLPLIKQLKQSFNVKKL